MENCAAGLLRTFPCADHDFSSCREHGWRRSLSLRGTLGLCYTYIHHHLIVLIISDFIGHTMNLYWAAILRIDRYLLGHLFPLSNPSPTEVRYDLTWNIELTH